VGGGGQAKRETHQTNVSGGKQKGTSEEEKRVTSRKRGAARSEGWKEGFQGNLTKQGGRESAGGGKKEPRGGGKRSSAVGERESNFCWDQDRNKLSRVCVGRYKKKCA